MKKQVVLGSASWFMSGQLTSLSWPFWWSFHSGSSGVCFGSPAGPPTPPSAWKHTRRDKFVLMYHPDQHKIFSPDVFRMDHWQFPLKSDVKSFRRFWTQKQAERHYNHGYILLLRSQIIFFSSEEYSDLNRDGSLSSFVCLFFTLTCKYYPHGHLAGLLKRFNVTSHHTQQNASVYVHFLHH